MLKFFLYFLFKEAYKMNNRFKNPYFWFGLVGVICAAANISFESLTSWEILYEDLMNILANPFLLGSVIVAVVGVFVNPTTKGLKDNNKNSTNDLIKK